MNVKKCENGHFYDSDSFPSCPHCINEQKKGTVGKRIRKHLLKFRKDTGTQSSGNTAVPEEDKTAFVCEPTEVLIGGMTDDIHSLFTETELQRINASEKFFEFPESPDKTMEDIFTIEDEYTDMPDEDPDRLPVAAEYTVPEMETVPELTSDTEAAPVPDIAPVPEMVPMTEETAPAEITEGSNISAYEDPLSSDADASHETDDAIPANTGNEATVKSGEKNDDIFSEAVTRFDPVVGWLVGLSGPDKGRSFELFTGRNSVGRSKTFSVPLGGYLSAEPDFFIIYDGRKNRYTLSAGSSRDIVYVNREPVLMNTELPDRCTIDISDRKYLFMPICDSGYDWKKLAEQ